MSDQRCEPPDALRGVDGWHWVEAPAIKLQVVRRWWRARGEWCWANMDERTLRSFRYLSPVLTPAEADALQAEVERLRTALQRISKHPAADGEYIDYGPDRKQRIWPTVRQECSAALTPEAER